jgi:hypothetical protein
VTADLGQGVYDWMRNETQCGCYCGHCALSAGCPEVRKDIMGLIRKAQADALREAASGIEQQNAAIKQRHYAVDAGAGAIVAWLCHRADRIERGE